MRVYRQHPARAVGLVVAMGVLLILLVLGASREPVWRVYVAMFMCLLGLAVAFVGAYAKLMVGSDVVIVRDNFVSHRFERGQATASVRETRHASGVWIQRRRYLTLTNSADGQSSTFSIGDLSKAQQRTLLADVEAALGQPIEGREFVDV